jgi:uncharacterized membrane protein YgaE (UPF0421/DUF939 family)
VRVNGASDRPDRRSSAKRIERALNRRLDAKAAFDRTVQSVPAILQIVIAGTIAYFIAHELLGHQMPAIAVTVTISILGFSRDARPRRVLESAVGILTGIVLSEIVLTLLGTGWWQLASVLFITLLVARVVSPSAPFAIAAGVQGALVMLMPAPDGGVFLRSVDGIVGGVVALVVTALIPRDPRRIAERDARRLVATLSESLDSVVTALREAHEPAAGLALERLRRTQGHLDAWTESLESAIAIARISPFLRRHLPTLRHQARVLAGLDLASRHLRVVTRRIDFLVRDGVPRPVVADLFSRIAAGIDLLGESLRDPTATERARAEFVAIMPLLDPTVTLPEARMPTSIVVHLLRPLLVDLSVATGMTSAEARALLPPV